MSFIRGQSNVVALAAATSANGTPRNGASLPMNTVQPGCLALRCVTTIVTGSVVASYKLQVSVDGTNFIDFPTKNNAAFVTVTASGSVVLPIEPAASAYPYVRAVATLSGASTAAGDTTAVTYDYLRYGLL